MTEPELPEAGMVRRVRTLLLAWPVERDAELPASARIALAELRRLVEPERRDDGGAMSH